MRVIYEAVVVNYAVVLYIYRVKNIRISLLLLKPGLYLTNLAILSYKARFQRKARNLQLARLACW